MNKEEKEAIEIQFERNLELLVRQKFPLTATAIVNAEQPMILLFEELIHRIEIQDNRLKFYEKQDKEIQKLRKKNNDLLIKLRNRIKQVNKLAKYSNYKKEFSNLNKKIEKQDKEIELLSKKLYLCTPEIPQHEHQYVSYVDLINKMIKQDKIIDKMAQEILRMDTAKSKFEYDHAKVWDTEKGIKEYFKKAVEISETEESRGG